MQIVFVEVYSMSSVYSNFLVVFSIVWIRVVVDSRRDSENSSSCEAAATKASVGERLAVAAAVLVTSSSIKPTPAATTSVARVVIVFAILILCYRVLEPELVLVGRASDYVDASNDQSIDY